MTKPGQSGSVDENLRHVLDFLVYARAIKPESLFRSFICIFKLFFKSLPMLPSVKVGFIVLERVLFAGHACQDCAGNVDCRCYSCVSWQTHSVSRDLFIKFIGMHKIILCGMRYACKPDSLDDSHRKNGSEIELKIPMKMLIRYLTVITRIIIQNRVINII